MQREALQMLYPDALVSLTAAAGAGGETEGQLSTHQTKELYSAAGDERHAGEEEDLEE